ncbi:MAG: type II secretion system protein M [Sinobacteraceae bacterium]|nr:type II secretion system protein M [Nevskiaceae bacterium]MBV8855265.1 type II secretion system protein M [Nevskiaceae bacterium]MBV9912653.1 type II secretion system protein M [Nevskiaceae bacterium]
MAFSFETLSARERRMVLICGIIALLVLVFGVLLPLNHSVTQARTRIGQKQADLQWMRNVTPVLLANTAQGSTNGESLIVVVDRSARESGLGSALSGSEPAGPNGLRVRLEKAPFDSIIGWLARLAQQNGIRVEAASIDTAGSPGMVNASLTLQAR